MGFDQLSSEQQRALFTEAAQKAFFAWHRNNYGVLELISLRSNAVFSVTYPKSSMAMRHILRVNWPERKPREVIDGEMQWMSALRRAGLPVPSVIRVPLPVKVDGVPEMICTLTEFLDGAETAATDYTPRHAAAVGRAAARIHDAAAASGLTRPRLDLTGCSARIRPTRRTAKARHCSSRTAPRWRGDGARAGRVRPARCAERTVWDDSRRPQAG
ncbi:MAG: phosphotransferase [Chloroflexi bacterium]|nr:phosphotransferase [Chloroflexota bacterium]